MLQLFEVGIIVLFFRVGAEQLEVNFLKGYVQEFEYSVSFFAISTLLRRHLRLIWHQSSIILMKTRLYLFNLTWIICSHLLIYGF